MQVKYLNFKILTLGVVNEESEVFLPHGLTGFIPNLEQTVQYQLCDAFCGKGLPTL
jgi:hypothetical protein